MTIAVVDWIVIGAYLASMVGFGLWLARKTRSSEDYFLGGRNIPPMIAAMSIMATQTSTNSLVGVPAFVALKPGGGLRYLQWEIALPVAMLLIMVIFVPMLWKSGVVTIYEYLERRFSLTARLVLSAVFLLSRSLATGVTIYATAVILSVATGAPIWGLIFIIGAVCLVYSTLGGLVADVYTDAIQLVVLWGCVFVSIGAVVYLLGDVSALATLSAERSVALDFNQHGLGDGAEYGFWPLIIGGVFLYMSYYGTDQTQVQRVLAAPSVSSARKSLFINGLLRFPLVMSYVVFGVALAALVARHPEIIGQLSVSESGSPKWDELVPVFIVNYLPTGLVGVMIAGMLAASMSSLDSTFNSLSASTMTDYVLRFKWLTGTNDARYMLVARGSTFVWGLLCCLFAFVVGDISDTVVESVNKIGSVFYGPVLAVFLLAFTTRFVRSGPAIAGLAGGVGLNLYLWLAVPSVSWLWWNVFGFLLAVLVAIGFSLPHFKTTPAKSADEIRDSEKTTSTDLMRYLVLILATVLILALSWGLSILVTAA
jgi:SSS family transporter